MRRLLALTLVFSFCLAARAPAATDSAGTPAGTVAFVGDSNLALSATAMAEQLLDRDHGWIIENLARYGAGIRTSDCPGERPCPTYDFWQARIPPTLKPDVWVVDLGINDAWSPGTTTSAGYRGYAAKIDWLMGLLPGPVLWTNLPCAIEPTGAQIGCRAIDAALIGAQKRWANLTVVDWASIAHRAYLGIGSAVAGVHLTTPGQTAYAVLVAKTLDK